MENLFWYSEQELIKHIKEVSSKTRKSKTPLRVVFKNENNQLESDLWISDMKCQWPRGYFIKIVGFGYFGHTTIRYIEKFYRSNEKMQEHFSWDLSRTDRHTKVNIDCDDAMVFLIFNITDLKTEKFWDTLSSIKISNGIIIGICRSYLPNDNSFKAIFNNPLLSKLKRKIDTILIVPICDKLKIHSSSPLNLSACQKDESATLFIELVISTIGVPSIPCVDYDDVIECFRNAGFAYMSRSTAEGDNKFSVTVEESIRLLYDKGIELSKCGNVFYNIDFDDYDDSLMDHIVMIGDALDEKLREEQDVIWSTTFRNTTGDEAGISIVVTGIG